MYLICLVVFTNSLKIWISRKVEGLELPMLGKGSWRDSRMLPTIWHDASAFPNTAPRFHSKNIKPI